MSGVLINGAGGRIGRAVTHEMFGIPENGPMVVALNEPRGIDFVVDNYRSRDPVHGVYPWKVEKGSEHEIVINGQLVYFSAEKDISRIPFEGLGIQCVMECSGFFGDPKQKDKKVELRPEDNGARAFLKYGVQRVIQTYPAKTADISMIMGVNHSSYDPTAHRVISNASCTTKALALPLQVLIDNGVYIDALSMDTTHAATASQEVLGSLGQIVTHSTGAAKATGLVIPSLKGRMQGMSYRVPTLDGSFANLYMVVLSGDHKLTPEKVNDMFREAVKNPVYAGRIGVFKGEDAGTFDIVGRRENAVVIPSKTAVIPLSIRHEDLSKPSNAYLLTVISGYDNELGSAVDPVLLARHISKVSI
jgi:glyceraldehyde 3-phosphate dehydrogenase